MILAILQARTSSKRFPKKVLKPLLGKPMIVRQYERISRSTSLDLILVATSLDPSDDELADLCEQSGIRCFRGNLEDVLDRFYQAALTVNPNHIVRLTADCPLIDHHLIDMMVEKHIQGGYDYTTNIVERTYPDGLDVEIMRFETLERAWEESILPSEREHVTPYVWKHPDRFLVMHIRQGSDLSHYRWTVDEEDDFQFVSKVYEALYPQKNNFSSEDILFYLQCNPSLLRLNDGKKCNEGYFYSLQRDKMHG